MEALKLSEDDTQESPELHSENEDNGTEAQDNSASQELFYQYLSLISPGFIESMTTFSGGGKKDPLVDVLYGYLGIEDSAVPKSVKAKEGTVSEGTPKRGRAKILPFESKEQKKDKLDDCESTSAFIYKEKKKAEKVNKQVKGKEIIELYQKSSQVNVKQERALRQDLSKSYKVGVLINKRQY